jgi:hypothetical protein
MMFRSALRPCAALFGFALLGGCANLEIEVDVYKGPLVNHETMQAQELGAMAIAARPLLVGLRDDLAKREIAVAIAREGDSTRAREWRANPEKFYGETCGYLGNTWVRRFDEAPCKYLVGARASRVNAILSLYEPADGEPGPAVQRFLRAQSAYRTSLMSLRGDPESDRARWQRMQSSFVSPPNAIVESLRYIAIPTDFRRSGDDSSAIAMVRALGHPDQAQSSNQAFHFLETNGAWHQTAAGVFATSALEATRKELIDLVVAQAGAYRATREALRNGIEAAFELYEDPADILQSRGTLRDAAAVRRARWDAARAVGTLIQGESLVVGACLLAQGAPSSVGPALAELRERFRSLPGELLQFSERSRTAIRSRGYGPANGRVADEVEDWLREGATRGDAAVSERIRALRLMHDRLKGSTLPTQVELPTPCDDPSIAYGANPPGSTRTTLLRLRHNDTRRFLYGLARGPTFDSETLSSDNWSSTIGAAAGGLEDARDPLGLVRRVADHIEASGKHGRGSREEEQAVARLLDATTEFARKVGFLADNESTFVRIGAPLDRATGPSLAYTASLQSVANQLIVMVDEIRRRRGHRDRFPATTERDSLARRLAEQDATTLVDQVLSTAGAQGVPSAARVAELEQKLGSQNIATTAKAAEDKVVATNAAVATAKSNFNDARNALEPSNLVADLIRRSVALALDAKRAEAAAAIGGGTFVSEVEVQFNTFQPFVAPSLRDYTPSVVNAATAYLGELLKRSAPSAVSAAAAARKDWAKRIEEAIAADLKAIAEKLKPKAAELLNAEKELKASQNIELLVKQLAEAKKKHDLAFTSDQRNALIGIVAQAQAAGRDGWQAMLDELRNRAESSAADKEVWKNAAVAARGMSPPIARTADQARATLPPAPAERRESAADTLDALIRSLRAEHIEVVRQAGPESPRARHVAAAIAVAYEHRSGVAYIRPPAAFLRMVNAASALQPDPGLGTENRLQRSFWRSLPLVGSAIANSGEEQNLRVRADIDRQNWQNINTVRMDGVGRTNYALVKDDIGNWYAKGYATEVKDIVDAMQGLATFSLGARLPGLSPTSLPRTSDGQVPAGGATRTDQSQMGRAFTRFRGDHAAKIQRIYDEVRKLTGADSYDSDGSIVKIAQTIESDTDVTDASKLRTALIELWKGRTAMPATPSRDAGQSEVDARRAAIISALEQLLVFRKGAVNSAEAVANVDKKSDVGRRMSAAITPPIQSQLDMLLAAMDEYDRQAQILGAATKE